MTCEEACEQGLDLVSGASVAMLGTNDDEGYPHIKAMLKMENEGLKHIWFSTNTSSRRVQQIIKNPKSCVYFSDPQDFRGLLLVGETELLQDYESKKRVWRDGFERYYPLGLDDPDYSVLRFTSQWGNYYHRLANIRFEL